MVERGFRAKLGARLKSARSDSGLSQQGLAKKLEISRTSVLGMESGKQSISVEQLVDIAKWLDVSPVDILRDVVEEASPASKALEGLPENQRAWIIRVKKGKEPK